MIVLGHLLRNKADRQEPDRMPTLTVQTIHEIHGGLFLNRVFLGTAFLVDLEPTQIFVFSITGDPAKY